jgi:hypothetical protein
MRIIRDRLVGNPSTIPALSGLSVTQITCAEFAIWLKRSEIISLRSRAFLLNRGGSDRNRAAGFPRVCWSTSLALHLLGADW